MTQLFHPLRGWIVCLLSIPAIAQPVRIIPNAHAGDVLGVFIDKSDTTVATCGIDGTIKLWQLPAMALRCTLTGHRSMINNISFAGSDTLVASVSSDRTLRVWSSRHCSQLRQLTGHLDDILCVYYSQSDTGRYIITGSADRTIKIWEWQTGAELKTLRGHTGAVTGVAYSYNDSLIASCGDDMQVLVWSPAHTTPIIPLIGQPHTAPCTAVLFSFDSRYLASADRE
ncbi:MAG: WD40 repeat domain-containing protein, partial [Chlorobi bacterium]|nr:WD40 repeat domain-containing protein [Chlorobiota bacterium]